MTEFDNRIPYAKPRPEIAAYEKASRVWGTAALLALIVLCGLLIAHAVYGQIDAFVDMQRAME